MRNINYLVYNGQFLVNCMDIVVSVPHFHAIYSKKADIKLSDHQTIKKIVLSLTIIYVNNAYSVETFYHTIKDP